MLCLNKMAAVLGCPEDAMHWNETVGMSGLEAAIEAGWEQGTAGMFGDTSGGVAFPNLAPAANTAFPRDWVRTMAETWMDDSVSAVELFSLLLRTTYINLCSGEMVLRQGSPDRESSTVLG